MSTNSTLDNIQNTLDESETKQTITLVSKDGHKCEILKSYTKLSKLITTSLENDNDTEINLGSYIDDKDKLETIVEFLTIQKGEEPVEIEKPLQSEKMSNVTTKENANFINAFVKQYGIIQLYKLLSIANFLMIDSLMHLCAARIAAAIKGKPLDQIKDILEDKIKYSEDENEDHEEKSN